MLCLLSPLPYIYIYVSFLFAIFFSLNKTSLVYVSPASEEKFRSIYKIAETVPFERAVINLVTLAQVALYLFNLLKKEYIDGLICNETTQAFWQFYTKYHPHKSPEVKKKKITVVIVIG